MSELREAGKSATMYGQLKIDKDAAKKIESIYNKLKNTNEFEVMLFNYKSNQSNLLNMESFLNILEYIKKRSSIKKERLEEITTLDVVYSDDNVNYRVSVKGIDNIHHMISLSHRRRNHVIFKIMLGEYLKKERDMTFIKKIRNMDNIIDIDDYDTRFRISDELEVSDKEVKQLQELDETARSKITYRFKQRVSLFVDESKDSVLRIDLTNSKQTNNINRIEQSVPRYELEIDYTSKSSKKSDLDKIYHEVEVLHKVIQQGNFVVSNSEKSYVLEQYMNIVGTTDKRTSLAGRKPQSLEIQHVVDILPNKYAVTDKADGERFFLIIVSGHVYLISNNLHVKYTGIELDKKLSKYNGSILDGEYIFIPKINRHLFMVFDCLFNGDTDVRKESTFMSRLEQADEIVNACFILKGQKGYKFTPYSGKYNSDSILKYHDKEITEYMERLNGDSGMERKFPLIRRKYFIDVNGAEDNEIFKYSQLMWKKYTKDSKTACPYILDGLIYHPLEQKYSISTKETKYYEYKWKPPEKNSIDFFIRFEKDINTGKPYVIFDDSKDEYVKGKPYKICHLHVGKSGRNGEQPTLFQREIGKYMAYMFLENGEVRDQNGDIIQDNTVVEFYYNTEGDMDDKYRWRAMRTRYDKTESVLRHHKNYGNFIDIANRVWRSIINPFTMNDISILAGDKYNKHRDFLRSRIDHSLIMSERKENIYYQIRTNLAKPMRQFHNWIKSILIYTYCNQVYERGNKLSVLDIGCGKGGDIMKYYYTMVSFMVGIDIDSENLLSAVDGAVSRYNQLKSNKPNFPKMSFIHADAGALLDFESQTKVLGGMSTTNKVLMEKYFSTDSKRRTSFDRITCQFAIHFFLENDVIWDNFCNNIDSYLKDGGYFMFTCFDAERLVELLKDKDNHTSYYTNEKGEKKIMFDIVKKYVDSDKAMGLGCAIDVHNAIDFQEDVYLTEYLVDKRFIVPELLERCNLELVQTDMFDNQFHIHKDYFDNIIKYEENPKTREFLKNVSEYYKQNDSVNKACFEWTRLNRYYVFRKKEGTKPKYSSKSTEQTKSKSTQKKLSKGKKSSKKQKGGGMNGFSKLDNIEYLLGKDKYYFRDNLNLKQYSFQESVYHLLRDSEIIPKNVSQIDFYKDVGIEMKLDSQIDTTEITQISKSLKIDHEYPEAKDKVLDGLNFLILERDCDNDVNITGYGKKTSVSKKDPTVILYKDDSGFHPVYHMKNKKLTGIFGTDKKIIKKLMAEI